MSDDHTHRAALCARASSGESLKYLLFWGHRPDARGSVTASCFSQWYAADFVIDGQHYPTAEHWMMAAKAELFDDAEVRARILTAANPGAAKALGRQVRGFDEQRWIAHRFAIVVRGNRAKFSQHPALAEFLARTGHKVLVEASPVDRVWGVGLARDDARATDPQQWPGLNLLGFALMQVRESLATFSQQVRTS